MELKKSQSNQQLSKFTVTSKLQATRTFASFKFKILLRLFCNNEPKNSLIVYAMPKTHFAFRDQKHLARPIYSRQKF